MVHGEIRLVFQLDLSSCSASSVGNPEPLVQSFCRCSLLLERLQFRPKPFHCGGPLFSIDNTKTIPISEYVCTIGLWPHNKAQDLRTRGYLHTYILQNPSNVRARLNQSVVYLLSADISTLYRYAVISANHGP